MKKFRITRMREALFGIAEVEGRRGFWPLHRPVHYRVGVNCDAIAIDRGSVVVLHAGAPIASASYSPSAQYGASSGPRWEDLLGRRKRDEP
jgi:hypothetical protein